MEIQCLRELGVTNSHLRYLLREGYVEHGTEVTKLKSRSRVFRKTPNLKFTDHTCFVLSPLGQSFAYKAGAITAVSNAAG